VKRTPIIVGLVSVTAGAVALVAAAPMASAQPADAAKAAASTVSALVARHPAFLHASASDAFVQRGVYTLGRSHVVAYDRTFKGVPVRGGDFVMVTDATGAVTANSVAQTRPIDAALSTTPTLTSAQALALAKKQLKSVSSVEGTQLVVDANSSQLAWESTINGIGAKGISRLTVLTNARTGALIRSTEHVTEGTGTGWINGQVPLNTTSSGGTFRMQDPTIRNLSCQDAANNTTFSGPDDVWGNGTSTNRETGCVDALYVAQRQVAMLSTWLNRNGQDGSGGAWPIRVGLNDLNAFYDGNQVQIGHNQSNQWITAADVVGHELGHGIDDHTPGGISGRGTQEFVADTFGAATEWFANNPNDPPDFQVGEEINLVGSGPIRYMYDPQLAGDDNCYTNATPNQEVHAAAGPGNHWFYLMAEGTSPSNGQPNSPVCAGSGGITGIGIQKAIQIMYGAMLLKTSASSYLNYRTWTLTAAKSLFPNSCTEFNAVKAAWNAVTVPAQANEPTCSGGETPPTEPPTTPPGGGTCTATNSTSVSIPDAGPAVTSSVSIGNCNRRASATSTVKVDITHTYRGDLRIDLVAPDGSVYNLKGSNPSDGADNVKTTFTANVSSENANGTWRLRVQDVFRVDTGKINSWTLTV